MWPLQIPLGYSSSSTLANITSDEESPGSSASGGPPPSKRLRMQMVALSIIGTVNSKQNKKVETEEGSHQDNKGDENKAEAEYYSHCKDQDNPTGSTEAPSDMYKERPSFDSFFVFILVLFAYFLHTCKSRTDLAVPAGPLSAQPFLPCNLGLLSSSGSSSTSTYA